MILLFFLPSSLFRVCQVCFELFFVYQKEMNDAISFSAELYESKDFQLCYTSLLLSVFFFIHILF